MPETEKRKGIRYGKEKTVCSEDRRKPDEGCGELGKGRIQEHQWTAGVDRP